MAIYKIYPWYKKSDGGSYMIPSWSTGTDAEIVEALQKHYAGEIDLHDYWNVGDERQIELSAATGMSTQTITMVIMNKGGKILSDGITECAFIVGQKNCLQSKVNMDTNQDYTGGWDGCTRRTWCNSDYKNSFPSTIIGIFKQYKNITANGTGSIVVTSDDYFAPPAEKEVFGTNYNASFDAEQSLSQFEFYQTQTNRIKNIGWWVRSHNRSQSNKFLYTSNSDSNETTYNSAPNSTKGLAPFGVI